MQAQVAIKEVVGRRSRDSEVESMSSAKRPLILAIKRDPLTVFSQVRAPVRKVFYVDEENP